MSVLPSDERKTGTILCYTNSCSVEHFLTRVTGKLGRPKNVMKHEPESLLAFKLRNWSGLSIFRALSEPGFLLCSFFYVGKESYEKEIN